MTPRARWWLSVANNPGIDTFAGSGTIDESRLWALVGEESAFDAVCLKSHKQGLRHPAAVQELMDRL